jgi:hypothetical protein
MMMKISFIFLVKKDGQMAEQVSYTTPVYLQN